MNHKYSAESQLQAVAMYIVYDILLGRHTDYICDNFPNQFRPTKSDGIVENRRILVEFLRVQECPDGCLDDYNGPKGPLGTLFVL